MKETIKHLTVRKVIALTVAGVFSTLWATQQITNDVAMPIATMIIGWYFEDKNKPPS